MSKLNIPPSLLKYPNADEIAEWLPENATLFDGLIARVRFGRAEVREMRTIHSIDGQPVKIYTAEYNKNHDDLGRFAHGSTRGRAGAATTDEDTLGGPGLITDDATAEDIIRLYEDLNLDDRTEATATVGDPVLGRIYEAAGYNGKPTMVKRAGFEKALDLDTPNLYRGFAEPSMLEQYISGEHYPGRGLFGSGTYASVARSIAKRYTSTNSIMRLTYKGTAKVITYDNLAKEMNSFYKKHKSKVSDKILQSVLGNSGRFAAMRGYDVINVVGAFNDSQFVILNRGAAVVLEA